MDSRVRIYLAELFGAFFLVLIGAGTVCSTFLVSADDPRYARLYAGAGGVPLTVALAEGIALAVVVTATCRFSPSCCNPAITLSLWVQRRLETRQAFSLIAVQAAGAFLGGMAVRGLFADTVLAEARMGAPTLRALLGPDDSLSMASLFTGAAVEFTITFLLTVAAFATLIDPRGPQVGGLLIGATQTAAVLFGFHLTGGCANPARWFGPAVWQLTLSLPDPIRPMGDLSVYLVGPILGALVGGVFYGLVILPEVKKR